MLPNPKTVETLISIALSEDIGKGDITTQAIIPINAKFKGIITAHQEMIIAGLDITRQVFKKLTSNLLWHSYSIDGSHITKKTILADIAGPAREILTAERTALNFLQHLSGIATLTHKYVQAIKDTQVILLDTRKTIPCLRELAKYATNLGGAQNHRLRLDDGVLIKDNHLIICNSIKEAITKAKNAGLKNIEVECETLEQVREAISAGANRLLLDNMNLSTLQQAVLIAKKHNIITEASGGINLQNIRNIALSGVNYISTSYITQSAPSVNISLDWSCNL